MKKKYHFVYKTTHSKSGRYYIGVHSTKNLKDNYLGSGKILKGMVSKYGKPAFKIQILEWFKTREEAYLLEESLVNKETLQDPLCINLREGGEGPGNGKDHPMYGRRGPLAPLYGKTGKAHPRYGKKEKEENRKERSERMKGKGNPMYGRSGSLSPSYGIGAGKGKGNPSYGTVWINDGRINKRAKPEILDLYLSQGWTRGRI